jgi:hypothetical protein
MNRKEAQDIEFITSVSGLDGNRIETQGQRIRLFPVISFP